MNKPIYHQLNRNIDWNSLLLNPAAIDILKDNLDKVNWFNLSAIDLLKDNLDKVNWFWLSGNSNAIHLLAKLDYKQMKDNWVPVAEELAIYVFNPARLTRLSKIYGFELVDIDEIY